MHSLQSTLPSSGSSKSSLPQVLEGASTSRKKRFLLSKRPTPSTSLNLLEIQERAESFGISKRAINTINSEQLILFSDLHANNNNLSNKEISSLEITKERLIDSGITKETWEKEKKNYIEAVKLLRKAKEDSDSKGEQLTISTIINHHELAESLKQIAKNESIYEPCSLILGLCLDRKIIELQGLADFQKPSFDWREAYSKVITHVSTYGDRGATTCHQQPEPQMSQKVIMELATSEGIPHVAYAPSSYYDDGPVLFPLAGEDKKARNRFSKTKQNDLEKFERRLLDSGCTVEFYHACWYMFCEYTEKICNLETDTLTNEEELIQSLSSTNKAWIQWVKNNYTDKLEAKLFSLMIDNINLVIIPRHKIKPDQPCFNWRDIPLDTPALSEEEILEYFDDFDTESVVSSRESMNQPFSQGHRPVMPRVSDSKSRLIHKPPSQKFIKHEIDSDDNEFSAGYEERRMKQLAEMQAKFGSCPNLLRKRKRLHGLGRTPKNQKTTPKRIKTD